MVGNGNILRFNKNNAHFHIFCATHEIFSFSNFHTKAIGHKPGRQHEDSSICTGPVILCTRSTFSLKVIVL